MSTTMIRGHFEKGVIVLDEPAELVDGMRVEVRVAPTAVDSAKDSGRKRGYLLPTDYDESTIDPEMPTHFEAFKDWIGTGDKDLPTDLAGQHDHYRLGTPKR